MPKLFYFISLASVFFGVLFTTLSLALPSDRFETAIIILSCVFSLVAGLLIHLVFSKTPRPVLFTSLLYLSCYYIGPGLVHMHIDRFPFFNYSYSSSTATTASIVVAIFVACYVMIAIWPSRRGDRSPLAVSTSRMPVIVVGLGSIALLCAVIVGLQFLHTRRGDTDLLYDVQTPIQLILTSVARAGSFILLLLCIAWLRRAVTALSVAFLLISIVIFFVINDPIALPRYIMGAYALSLFFVRFKQSTLNKAIFLAGMIAAQFTIFPMMSELTRGSKDSIVTLPDPVEYIAKHGDFDGFQSTMNVVLMTDGSGFKDGRQIASAVLFFVPRALIDWKSVGTGGDAATYAGYPYVNISAPLPSEFYVDFGIPGLVLLSLLFGWLVHFMDRAYAKRASRGDSFGLLTTSVIAGYITILMRGSLVGVLGPFAVSAAICILSIGFLTFKLRRRLPASYTSLPPRDRDYAKTGGSDEI